MEQRWNVLVVEDDAGIRQSLFETLARWDSSSGRPATENRPCCAFVWSTTMRCYWTSICQEWEGLKHAAEFITASPQIPIVMLTVRDEEDDKVEALDAGADDYVTKPFQIRELTARLRSIIRRSKTPAVPSDAPVVVGSLTLDPDRHRVEKMGQEIHLSPKEFELLRYLMEHAGRPVPHNRLLTSIWGPEYGNEREYLRVLVSQLRKKIEDDPAQPTYILTESYIGYRFREA